MGDKNSFTVDAHKTKVNPYRRMHYQGYLVEGPTIADTEREFFVVDAVKTCFYFFTCLSPSIRDSRSQIQLALAGYLDHELYRTEAHHVASQGNTYYLQ